MVVVLAIVALLLIAGLAWQGWRAGLLRRVLELAGAVVSFFFATSHAAGLGATLTAWTGLAGRGRLYAGWIALFVIGLILTRLLSALAGRFLHLTILGWVDRLGGAVCGLLFGVLVASALLHLAGRLPGGEARRAALAANPVTRPILALAPALSRPFHDLGGAPDRVLQGVREGARRTADAIDARLQPALPDSAAPARRPGG